MRDELDIKEVVYWLSQAYMARSQFEQKWKVWDRRFARDPGVVDWGGARSRIYIPLIYTQVQTLKDNLIEALWGGREDFFDLKPVEPLDVIPAKALKLVNQVWMKRGNALRELEDVIHQHVLHGTGCLTVHWDNEKGIPVFRWRDILSVFPAPSAVSVDSAEYIIVRSVVPKRQLLKMRELGVYKFSDAVLEGRLPLLDFTPSLTPEEERLVQTGGTRSVLPDDNAFAELLEVYRDDRTDYIINRKEVAYSDVHNFGEKPVIMTQMIRRQTGIWGDGIASVLAPEEDRQITLDNMQMDSIALQTYNMFIVRKGAFSAEDIVIRPEGILYVSGGRDERPLSDLIQPLQVRDTGGTASFLRNLSSRIAENATGVFPMIQGTSMPGVDTATEFAGLIRQASVRIKSYLRSLEMGLIEPAVRWMNRIAAANRYRARESIMRILGDRFMGQEVVPGFADALLDIVPEIDVMVKTGSRYINEQMVQKNLLLLAQIALQSPYTNVPLFLERVFEAYGIYDAAQMILVKPESGRGIIPPEEMGAAGDTGEELKRERVMEAGMMGAMTQ